MNSISSTPLIPRQVLFGNPEYVSVSISPNGEFIAYLAPYQGVLNVWVQKGSDTASATPITQDKGRGIRAYFWSHTNRHILYIQDKNGDENWHLYAIDLETKVIKDLTPFEGVQVRVKGQSEKYPTKIIAGINKRNPQHHDLYALDIMSGDLTLLEKNEEYIGYYVDWDLKVRFAEKLNEQGGREVFQKEDTTWKHFLTISLEDQLTTDIIGFDKSGGALYLKDSRGRDTSALVTMDLATGKLTDLGSDPRADISSILLHPSQKTIEGYSVVYDRERWTLLDEEIKKDFAYLQTLESGEIVINSRSLDNQRWIVAFTKDDGPARFYLYNRAQTTANFLFTVNKSLEKLPLRPMHTAIIPSRDGLSLVSYLTLPEGEKGYPVKRPTHPWPMVLFVHGGPHARNEWGYNTTHQWLANRGYAVLSVNFRASTGFGKAFINAGNGEWGRKMQDDLTDAVQWAIEQGIADPQRVAIMGASYGGYAVLAGLTLTPDLYACGVDIVGPSSLITILKTIPPYWKPLLNSLKVRIGADPDTLEGQRFLTERSPLTYVHKIKKPLLIGQGANDPRVKQAESDQIVRALQEKHLPVIYALYPDEGHGFARPENRISFNALTEAFLAKHLGGRYEPVGKDFEGSSVEIKVGAKEIGLEQETVKRVRQRN